ncbi:MAG: hypothetical protein ACI81T_004260, partial [Bacteroidia bacterium]
MNWTNTTVFSLLRYFEIRPVISFHLPFLEKENPCKLIAYRGFLFPKYIPYD